ncbi:MAG TPA: Abi family protein [Thermoleophilia bacterium]|nr:Abi family protein [Thermoleophilia bacterium]
MRHVRATSGMTITGTTHKRALARIGYFHGYKGYRFSGSADRRIPYSDFDELRAVFDFDSALKAMLYPILMDLEMAMKNLALVEILNAAGSSRLTDVYSRVMLGDKRDGRRGKLEVVHAGNGVLLDAYKRSNVIVRHYYDAPGESVPLWALMEVITLGHFGRFLEQLSSPVLKSVAESWGLRRRDVDLLPHLVYAVKDVRNCVAHDGTLFDTRFKTARIRDQIPALLVREISLPPSVTIQFDTITDYLVLIVYLSRCLGVPKREAGRLIKRYSMHAEELRNRVPMRIFDMIVHTDNRAKIGHVSRWVRST